jgi:hypothetical protein
MEHRQPGTEGPSGVGVDGARHVRPGVPRERLGRDPGAHWERPEQQRDVSPLARSGLLHATPVFSSALPPRRLSGALRRVAYRLPEHRASRWMLLLGSDRVDVLEHRLAAAPWLVPAIAALGVGYLAASRALRRPAWRR